MTTKLLLAALLLALPALEGCKRSADSGSAAGQDSHTTAGTVKSFGPAKAYVNILHDDIPGYMKSMTMSFEPRTPEQLANVKEGDRVRFTFTDVDGKRMLDKVEK